VASRWNVVSCTGVAVFVSVVNEIIRNTILLQTMAATAMV